MLRGRRSSFKENQIFQKELEQERTLLKNTEPKAECAQFEFRINTKKH